MPALDYSGYSWGDETKINILQSTLVNYNFTYFFVIATHQIMFSYLLYGIREFWLCHGRKHIAKPKDGRE